MFDDLHYDDNLRAAQDLAQRPPRAGRPDPAFSVWGALARGPSKGGVAGVSQSGAFFSDVLGAFGQTLAAGGTASAQGMFSTQTDAERRQADQQALRIRSAGPDFSSATGDDLRGFARSLTPDPETAHTAERIVFDAFRVLTKGAGYVTAFGGVPGALLTGADEGMTTADDLKQQGVDLATRTKVGAVVGGVTAVGAALPISGTNVSSTIALGATGGPLTFMAQQQAVRSILQAQDYTQLAEQYDPLDPVGLAVSTLVPMGFGAWGLRASRARAAAEAMAASEARARAAAVAEAEAFRTGPLPSGETPVARAVRHVSEEQIDAARTIQLTEQRRSASPFRADDWRAFDAHEAALTRAMDQIASGERVTVDDLLPAAPLQPETVAALQELDALQAERAQLLPAAGELAERGAIRAAREELRLMEQQRPDTSDAGIRELAKRIQEREGVSYRTALAQAKQQTDGALADFNARQSRLERLVESNARAQRAAQRVGEIDQRVAALEAQASPDAALPLFAKRLEAAGRATEALRIGPVEPRVAGPLLAPTRVASPGWESGLPAAAARDVQRGSAATGPALEAAVVAARVEQVRSAMPELMVQLDGMDAPMRVDDLLAAIKAEADDMLADGELFEQVALCALLHG